MGKSVQITGVEFKRFWDDESFWVDGAYVDDSLYKINGREVSGEDLDVEKQVSPADVVEVMSGYVVGGQVGVPEDLEEAFLWWRGRQGGVGDDVVIRDVTADKVEMLRKTVQELGLEMVVVAK